MTLFNLIWKKIQRKFVYRLDYSGERVIPTEMHGDVSTWVQHLSRYVFALRYAVNKDILDAACGTGYGSSLLSSVATSVIGVDISRDAIMWARRHNSFYSQAHFYVKDLDRNLITGNFDLVVSFETIEHMSNPQGFLTSIKSSLKPKGMFIFSVPLEDPPNRFHKIRYNWKLLESLIVPIFGKQPEWYSQEDINIDKGKRPRAKFAIGIWTKN